MHRILKRNWGLNRVKNKIRGFFNFATQMLTIFAVSILILAISSYLFGEEAQKISSIYSFGGNGLSIDTIFQFFLASFTLTLLSSVFFSDILFKKMRMLWRTILMLISTVGVIVLFIIVFKWFPVDSIEPWIGFIISFGLCFGISCAVIIIKTKLESSKFDRMLSEFKSRKQLDNK